MVEALPPMALLPSPTTTPLQELPSQTGARTVIQDWLAGGEPGLGVLTGGPASGRTRVLEQVVLWLAERDDRAIGFPQAPSGKRSDAGLLREAIAALGGESTGRTGLELTRDLRQRVQDLVGGGMPPLLLLDDADLTGSQLEILGSVFAGPGPDQPALGLQVLLAGPPEVLDRMQRRPRLAGLIRVTTALAGPSTDEVECLVDAWLAAARAADADLPTLSNGARESILQVAGTNPTIAFDLLTTSLQSARRMGTRRIGTGLTEAVAASMGSAPTRPSASRRAQHAPSTLPLPGLEEPAQSAGEAGR